MKSNSQKFTGYIEESRYVPMTSRRPAVDLLQSQIRRTRISTAECVRAENIGLLCYTLLSLMLVYIFSFGAINLCFDLFGAEMSTLRNGLTWCITGLVFLGIVVSIERGRRGVLKRLLWQGTIPLFGWPRCRQRSWLRQSIRVPVEIDFCLEGRPHIRWRANREAGDVVRSETLSSLPFREPKRAPKLSRDGSIDLLEEGLKLELTRDPAVQGRAHLRIRASTSQEGLDLALSLGEEAMEQLVPMSRTGVCLEEREQKRALKEIVQIALAVGSWIPSTLKGECSAQMCKAHSTSTSKS